MSDSTLYLYTSLTAGSSHIVTATARLETILKANKLPFRAIDVATDDAARKLWGRRSKGKKLPGLVKFGTVVGDLEEIEEWNEYGELRMTVNSVEDFGDSLPATSHPSTAPAAPATKQTAPVAQSAPPKQSTIKIQNPPVKETPKDDSISVAMKQASEEAANKAKENKQAAAAKSAAATEAKSEPKPVEETTAPAAGGEQKKNNGEESVRRQSIAAEIAEKDGLKRPPMPEVAAVSSANIRADHAEALGLVGHHRTSIVSATSKEEREQVAQDLRKSISGGHQDIIESLRDEQAEKGGDQGETIEEDPFEEEEEAKEDEAAIEQKKEETQKQEPSVSV